MRGSPIRKSSDQRSVDSSPRLIAASYVLHRLLVPRHPPCALNNLATQKSHPTHPRKEAARRAYKNSYVQSQKMLASTVQFSTYDQTPPNRPRRPTPPAERWRYENRRALTEKKQPIDPEPGQTVRSLRTQQRAYEPNPTSRLRSTHPPKGMPYWEPATRAGRTGQRSTLEHHPRRSAATRGPGDRHGLGAALDHSHEESGQCSLERR